MVTFWCDDMARTYGKSVERIEYGDGALKYTSARSNLPAVLCRVDNSTSFGFIHIFGSPDEGPYLNREKNQPSDEYTNSRDRVAKAFSLYFEYVPWPDRVFLHTAIWDSTHYMEDVLPNQDPNTDPSSPFFIAALDDFRNNTHKRIDQVEDILKAQKTKLSLTNAQACVGLRTAPWGAERGLLLHGLNDVIRSVASQRHLTFFDYDRDVWFSPISLVTGAILNSSMDEPIYDGRLETMILSDHLHPYPDLLLSGAKKIMGTKFTQFMRFTGPMAPVWLARFLDPLSNYVSKALLVRERKSSTNFSSPIYCLHVHPKGERHVVHHSFLQVTHFAQGDVMNLDALALDKYRIGRPLPNFPFTTHASWGIAKEQFFYKTAKGGRFSAPSGSYMAAEHQFNASLANTMEEVPEEGEFWIDELLPILGDCPRFANKTMVQINGQRVVFLVLDDVRHSIPCWNYISFLGLDGGAIQKYGDDFEKLEACVPEGSPLNGNGVC